MLYGTVAMLAQREFGLQHTALPCEPDPTPVLPLKPRGSLYHMLLSPFPCEYEGGGPELVHILIFLFPAIPHLTPQRVSV